MNTEQLKMVVDLINGLGAHGKDAFLAWLIANYGVSAFTTVAGCALVGVLGWKLMTVVWELNKPESQEPKFSRGTTLEGAACDYWLYHAHKTPEAKHAAYLLYKEVERLNREDRGS